MSDVQHMISLFGIVLNPDNLFFTTKWPRIDWADGPCLMDKQRQAESERKPFKARIFLNGNFFHREETHSLSCEAFNCTFPVFHSTFFDTDKKSNWTLHSAMKLLKCGHAHFYCWHHVGSGEGIRNNDFLDLSHIFRHQASTILFVVRLKVL